MQACWGRRREGDEEHVCYVDYENFDVNVRQTPLFQEYQLRVKGIEC